MFLFPAFLSIVSYKHIYGGVMAIRGWLSRYPDKSGQMNVFLFLSLISHLGFSVYGEWMGLLIDTSEYGLGGGLLELIWALRHDTNDEEHDNRS